MQTGKNYTNDTKFANLATENYGRKNYHTISLYQSIIIQGLTNRVSGCLGLSFFLLNISNVS